MSTHRLSSNPLPPGVCFTTPQALLDLFTAHQFVNFTNTTSFFSVSREEPAIEKRGSPWLKVDDTNRPVGWYFFYNGAWRRVPGVPLGTIQLYDGPISVFDTTGLGKVATEMDGWALCNGKNGTPNLSDRFVAGSNMTAAGFGYESGVWKTKIVGDTLSSGGGTSNYKLTLDALPPREVTVGTFDLTNQTILNTKNVIKPNIKPTTAKPNGLTLSEQETLPLPPYVALAYVKFVGYR